MIFIGVGGKTFTRFGPWCVICLCAYYAMYDCNIYAWI